MIQHMYNTKKNTKKYTQVYLLLYNKTAQVREREGHSSK